MIVAAVAQVRVSHNAERSSESLASRRSPSTPPDATSFVVGSSMKSRNSPTTAATTAFATAVARVLLCLSLRSRGAGFTSGLWQEARRGCAVNDRTIHHVDEPRPQFRSHRVAQEELEKLFTGALVRRVGGNRERIGDWAAGDVRRHDHVPELLGLRDRLVVIYVVQLSGGEQSRQLRSIRPNVLRRCVFHQLLRQAGLTV